MNRKARHSNLCIASFVVFVASTLFVVFVDGSTADARLLSSALRHRKLGPEYATPSVREFASDAFWDANEFQEIPDRSAGADGANDQGAEDAEAADADEPVFRDASGASSSGTVGTYDTCDTCEQCALGSPPAGVVLSAPRASADVNHCRLCYGCDVVLDRLPGQVVFKGRARPIQLGASNTAVFKGKILDDQGAVKNVFVKSWCGLQGKYRHVLNLQYPCPETCPDDDLTYEEVVKRGKCPDLGMSANRFCNQHFLNAIDRIAVEAGLGGVTPRTWTVQLRTFTPWDEGLESSSGVKQNLLMQLFEPADGVSLESLGPKVDSEKVHLVNLADFDRIRDITLFDFLTSQRDRHGQNVFFDARGVINVIDNESAMTSSARAGLNSMFIPGGQKHETYRVGYDKVTCRLHDTCDSTPNRKPTMGILLDYRCYVVGGYIGKDYPSKLKAYLEKLEGMSVEEVQTYYEFPRARLAEELKERAHNLLFLGFEGAVKVLYAGMRSGLEIGQFGTFEYDITPPCCGPKQCEMQTVESGDSIPCVGEPLCAHTSTPEARAFVGPNNRDSVAAFLKAIGISDEYVAKVIAKIPVMRSTTPAALPPKNASVAFAPLGANGVVLPPASAQTTVAASSSAADAVKIEALKRDIELARLKLMRAREDEQKVEE